MVSEGRLCCWPPRLVCGVPRLLCWCPPSVCVVAVLNGGGGVCCDAPCLDWVRHLCVVMLPFALSCSFYIIPPFTVFAVTALLV